MDYFQINQAIKFWGTIATVAFVLIYFVVMIFVSWFSEKRREGK